MSFFKYCLKQFILTIGNWYMGFVDTFIISPLALTFHDIIKKGEKVDKKY